MIKMHHGGYFTPPEGHVYISAPVSYGQSNMDGDGNITGYTVTYDEDGNETVKHFQSRTVESVEFANYMKSFMERDPE